MSGYYILTPNQFHADDLWYAREITPVGAGRRVAARWFLWELNLTVVILRSFVRLPFFFPLSPAGFDFSRTSGISEKSSRFEFCRLTTPTCAVPCPEVQINLGPKLGRDCSRQSGRRMNTDDMTAYAPRLTWYVPVGCFSKYWRQANESPEADFLGGQKVHLT